MATNKKDKKDLFKNNLSAKKPSDKKIEAITNEIVDDAPQEVKGFFLKFPKSDFDKLSSVSKKTHIPKKYIIIEALKDYYDKYGY